MAVGLLLAGVVEAIDKRHRAFLWTGEETCHGGKCKVAWTDVCVPKNLGGLGILSIQSQNSTHLTKFLTKLHSDTSAPWADWFRRHYGWNDSRDLWDTHHHDTHVRKDIAAGLVVFRSITKVSVGNGASTAFWTDLWTGDATL
jgi:hypothetical protein